MTPRPRRPRPRRTRLDPTPTPTPRRTSRRGHSAPAPRSRRCRRRRRLPSARWRGDAVGRLGEEGRLRPRLGVSGVVGSGAGLGGRPPGPQARGPGPRGSGRRLSTPLDGNHPRNGPSSTATRRVGPRAGKAYPPTSGPTWPADKAGRRPAPLRRLTTSFSPLRGQPAVHQALPRCGRGAAPQRMRQRLPGPVWRPSSPKGAPANRCRRRRCHPSPTSTDGDGGRARPRADGRRESGESGRRGRGGSCSTLLTRLRPPASDSPSLVAAPTPLSSSPNPGNGGTPHSVGTRSSLPMMVTRL